MTRIPHALRVTPTIARVAWSDLVAYRAEMVVWVLTAILPLFLLALWDAVLAEGDVAGFGRDEVARYFAATLLVRQLTGNWIAWELAYEIRQGQLSARLLRPLHPLWSAYIWALAALPWRIVILSPLLIGLALVRPELLAWPSPLHSVAFVVSVALAFTLSFLVQATFGALAFFIDKADGAFGVWFAVWTVASGYVAPLAFFPSTVVAAFRWLPFRSMLGVPVEMLAGLLPVQALAPALFVQAAWVLLAAATLRAVWAAGLARYGAFGA
jgi:ABC-2 type transport system permease protein